MEKKPTIFTVAERAGVSIASVSRVINGISTNTPNELKIRKAIADLGYQPHSAARALKVRATEQICIALPDLSNPVFQAMIRGVQRGFKFSKYRLMLSPSLSTTEEVVKQLKSLGKNYADGLIINALVIDEEVEELLLGLRIPVVLIGTSSPKLNFDNVSVDSVRGAINAVDYLFESGRKKILFMNGPWITNPAKRRKEGFIKGMKKHGFRQPESLIINAKSFSAIGAYQALEAVEKIEEYDAILCANDLLAAGTIKFLSEHKFKVPNDVSVIGIDNTELAGLLNPTLTSVDFKAEHRGEIAAKFMLERLANPELAPRKLIVEPEIVKRESA